ncbi:hypothetical protein AAF712_001558 [Marasmius tenuissimus]|uniref:Uncharacterized protein n=1 Tax=Marasmius tenuissimus TaxID=585030 RepID=A0ABR3ABW1_9AGAR
MAHWYPEGYVHPTSPAYPPGPQHPAYTTKIQVAPGQHAPWYAAPTPNMSLTAASSHPRRSSHSSSSSRTPRGSSSSGSVPAAHVVEPITDCVDGINYFKEYERDEARKGRCYFVAYVDPLTGALKEDKFFPDRQEIQDIGTSPDGHKRESVKVLAHMEPIPPPKGPSNAAGAGTWVLAQVLRNTDNGLRVLLRAGPSKGREVLGRKFMPYDAKVIGSARQNGLNVLLD